MLRLGSWTFALSLLGTGCCVFGNPMTYCDEPCRLRGECRLRTERTGDGIYACYAGADTDCAASEACTAYGRCSAAEDGTCVTAGEVAQRACAISRTCRVWGGCHPRDGFCEPQSIEDCTTSLRCTTEGRCTFDEARHACFATAGDCAGSTGCELEGLCSYAPDPFGYGSCVLPSGGSCTAALACTRDGRCAPRPSESCGEGCRIYYCARPEDTAARHPCTTQAAAELACEGDGRCMRSASGACERVP